MSGSAESAMVLLLAGDAGARDQVHKAARIFRHQFQPPLGAGGRGEKHGIEPGFAHHLHIIAGLFHAGVREQAAVDPGGFRVAREFLKAIAQHRVQIREQQQRNFRTLANLRGDVENLRQRGPGRERAVARLLDHRAIRDRIRKRHAQFDQIRAAAFERRE